MEKRGLMEMDPNHHIYPVLLAGGVGSRLWPVSRELYPKQLVKFIGTDSLIQSTIKRLLPQLKSENIRIVCGIEHYFEIARHMNEIGISSEDKILCEPCGRNTAPAILLAVLDILKKEKDSVLFVFPADHVINNKDNFHEQLNSAVQLAKNDHIVTFGIKPHYPETGYGYIEGGDSVGHNGLAIRRFVEKPDIKTAEDYIKAGNFFWNSGMFAFKASTIMEEFKKYQPNLVEQMEKPLSSKSIMDREDYEKLENISIDYAIMEKTEKGVVLPSDFGWSDIGSWKSLYDFLPKDKDNNVIDGDVILNKTHNSFIMGYNRLVAVNHLDNMVVVETPDSIFISDIDHSRDVKSIVSNLKKKGREEYHHHRTVLFPWGSRTLLDEDKEKHRVERIIIYPDSLCQVKTEYRSMVQLTLVEGTAEIETEVGYVKYKKGETADLQEPKEIKVKNPGNEPVCLIMLQIRKS